MTVLWLVECRQGGLRSSSLVYVLDSFEWFAQPSGYPGKWSARAEATSRHCPSPPPVALIDDTRWWTIMDKPILDTSGLPKVDNKKMVTRFSVSCLSDCKRIEGIARVLASVDVLAAVEWSSINGLCPFCFNSKRMHSVQSWLVFRVASSSASSR